MLSAARNGLAFRQQFEPQRACDRVIATIFVNPMQFGSNEDLQSYPRDEAGDLAQLRRVGADGAFLPVVEEMYPPGASTTVSVAGVSDGLCGPFRPGHFAGVATVVCKLLLQALPRRKLSTTTR